MAIEIIDTGAFELSVFDYGELAYEVSTGKIIVICNLKPQANGSESVYSVRYKASGIGGPRKELKESQIDKHEGKLAYLVNFKGDFSKALGIGLIVHKNIDNYIVRYNNFTFIGTPKEFDAFYLEYFSAEYPCKVVGIITEIIETENKLNKQNK